MSPHIPSRVEKAAEAPTGKLYIVGTPIGNLEDITLRALRVLKESDLIACEDTRRTAKLLTHYAIKTRTVSYHEHNEMTRAPELVLQLEQGRAVALVSDAGMPVISDPGLHLVKLAIRHGIPVVPVPGASAVVAALAGSGLPVEKFKFLGFLPAKRLARRRALEEMQSSARTLVFFEAPHRLVEMLRDALDILGDRPAVVAREVTKVHEEFVRGTPSAVLERFEKTPPKGEITVLIGPGGPHHRPLTPSSRGEGVSANRESISAQILRTVAERGIEEREALKVVAKSLGISRSEAYRRWQAEKVARRTVRGETL